MATFDATQPPAFDRRIGLALAASLLLHAGVTLLPGRQASIAMPRPLPLRANLTVPPAAVSAPVTADPSPRRRDGIAGRPTERRLADRPAPSADEATPAVDLEEARAVARLTTRPKSELPATANPRPAPAVETPLARGIARASRGDCRTAHAGKGLLALPFLLADTLTDHGCRW